MFKESPENLKNYIVLETYLEYAQWLLRDVKHFISFELKLVISHEHLTNAVDHSVLLKEVH